MSLKIHFYTLEIQLLQKLARKLQNWGHELAISAAENPPSHLRWVKFLLLTV